MLNSDGKFAGFVLCLLVAGALGGPATPVGANDTRYGAIAYSSSRTHWGYSTQYPTQAEADRNAIANCGKDDCQVVIGVQNSTCGALAIESRPSFGGSSFGARVWGAGSGADKIAAEEEAVSRCESSNGALCNIVATTCGDQ